MSLELFLSALVGASLAFCFFLTGEILNRAFERSRRHYNALWRLQSLLNSNLHALHFNHSVIPSLREDATAGRLFRMLPKMIRSEEGVLIDLYDERIMRDFFALLLNLDTLNHISARLLSDYAELVGRRLNETLTKEVYAHEAMKIVRGLEQGDEMFQAHYRPDLLSLLAEVRLRMNEERSLAWRVVVWTTKSLMLSPRPAELTDSNVNEEIARIEREASAPGKTIVVK